MSQINPTAAEALGDKVPFTHNGVDYLLDPASEWDVEALEVFESGKVMTFLRLILGEEQYAKYKATKPKAGAVNGFLEGIQKALGIKGN
ncbi:hypothetical protein ARTSIC4J27_592 [Pseudarthrobacter siccitolerans]|uniref:Tail assembly chaperone n=1 Tax=Pseudarthrobacter siccitolerans TaxID=861266 RepID=A0A024GXI5_9MICC|nr:hypothetical protein [Pseudarthrobacter siccitolerans]CCQ44665.1 hypothetical protein ARTSIC4J27_592 [Pseudarthrobacter siccitolerans]